MPRLLAFQALHLAGAIASKPIYVDRNLNLESVGASRETPVPSHTVCGRFTETRLQLVAFSDFHFSLARTSNSAELKNYIHLPVRSYFGFERSNAENCKCLSSEKDTLSLTPFFDKQGRQQYNFGKSNELLSTISRSDAANRSAALTKEQTFLSNERRSLLK